MKAIIVGAGIGGLTAALALRRTGWSVAIVEKAPALGEVGAGIQASPNAMKAFNALGLGPALARVGFAPEAIELRMGLSGMPLIRAPLGDVAAKRWGAPYLHLHRADLIAVLEDALRAQAPDALRLGAAFTRYEQDGDGVRAISADGAEISGDLLIGADGIHSAVQAQMLGPLRPTFTGNVAWRAVAPVDRLGADAPNPTAAAWMGRGRHAVTYRVRRGELANFVGVVERDDWTKESWTERGDRDDALADFEGWHPVITRLIEAAGALHRWALFDRPPLARWVEGRVALLGDAAHPMLPFMAQGAAMAVEDAWALAAGLGAGREVPGALKRYQALRFARASKVQAASRANAATFHKRSALGRFATYGPMWLAGRAAPAIGLSRQDWVYGYEIVAEAARAA